MSRAGSLREDRNGTEDEPIAILVFDLDRFKEINDTQGHNASDEFAIIASDPTESQIMEKLLSLEQEADADREAVPCRLSVGYAFIDPKENNAVEPAFALSFLK